jgi:transposase
MAADAETFSQWLQQAGIREHGLTPEQRGLLHGAFYFRQSRGDDYYSGRLLSHFLLHCGSGLKVAQVARLVGISRPTASRQQGMSSKEAIQQAHHRMDGRPYGKLRPRYAGPIAEYLFSHPQASRADLIDFIDRTFGVRVSRIALYKFLKKFGLDEATRQAAGAATPVPPASTAGPQGLAPLAPSPALPLPASVPFVGQGQPVPLSARGGTPPFSPHVPSTPAPFC